MHALQYYAWSNMRYYSGIFTTAFGGACVHMRTSLGGVWVGTYAAFGSAYDGGRTSLGGAYMRTHAAFGGTYDGGCMRCYDQQL